MTKTNVMRLLESAGIAYRTAEYEYDENNLSGLHAAEQIGIPAEQVFKTLVTRGDKTGILVFCIPVDMELDLKKAAAVSKNKKVEMTHMKELLALTGYIRGGCSPIGMKKKYPTFIDETCILFDEIAVSAGIRGEQVILSPEDLARFTEATEADLTKEMGRNLSAPKRRKNALSAAFSVFFALLPPRSVFRITKKILSGYFQACMPAFGSPLFSPKWCIPSCHHIPKVSSP